MCIQENSCANKISPSSWWISLLYIFFTSIISFTLFHVSVSLPLQYHRHDLHMKTEHSSTSLQSSSLTFNFLCRNENKSNIWTFQSSVSDFRSPIVKLSRYLFYFSMCIFAKILHIALSCSIKRYSFITFCVIFFISTGLKSSMLCADCNRWTTQVAKHVQIVTDKLLKWQNMCLTKATNRITIISGSCFLIIPFPLGLFFSSWHSFHSASDAARVLFEGSRLSPLLFILKSY